MERSLAEAKQPAIPAESCLERLVVVAGPLWFGTGQLGRLWFFQLLVLLCKPVNQPVQDS